MDLTETAKRLLEAVPANRSFGLQVLYAVDGVAEVTVEVVPAFTNVIGSLHSSGLVAVVDAAGLAAMISAAPSPAHLNGITPLGAAADIQFVTPAEGRLFGRCRLTTEVGRQLDGLYRRDVDRLRFSTLTEISDDHGVVVCRGTFNWLARFTGSARAR